MIDFPYFLRSKRRRLNDGNESYDLVPESTSYRRKNAVMHLPTEILIMVFRNLSYKELGFI